MKVFVDGSNVRPLVENFASCRWREVFVSTIFEDATKMLWEVIKLAIKSSISFARVTKNFNWSLKLSFPSLENYEITMNLTLDYTFHLENKIRK